MTRGTWISGGAVSIAALMVALLYLRSRASHGVAGERETEPDDEQDAGLVEWCAPGLVPVNGGGCFAAPEGRVKGAPLIVYLHGIYDEHATAEELDRQRRVAKLATEEGFAVLAVRGLLGGCGTADPALATKYCWPSNERTASRGPETVEEWTPSLRAADRMGATGPRYVLGFSNGGFFSGLLAVRAWFPAEAFVVANAGPVEPVKALGDKVPLLLVSADDDPSQDGMMRLDDELTREGWLHESYASPGTHELPDREIEAALTFFVRLRREKVPFSPPLSTHRPRAREAEQAPNPEAPSSPATDPAAEPAPPPPATTTSDTLATTRPLEN